MSDYFKIPTPVSSVNKTIRFPENIVNEVEEAIKGQDCTFSAFVIEATRVALNSLSKNK